MIQWEVRSTAEALSAASFGGRRIRRVPVQLAAGLHDLLLHDDGQATFLLPRPGQATGGAWATLLLNAEWGEPLGQVQDIETEPHTGRVQAYLITGRYMNGQSVRIEAEDTFWWQGELFCRKRRANGLRDLKRQAARVQRAAGNNQAA